MIKKPRFLMRGDTYHNCGGPITHFASWHLAMATPNLKILETVRRHYKDRFVSVATASGVPEKGRLGLPPGPGLGVDLRPDFLRSGKAEIQTVDENTRGQPPRLGNDAGR